MSLRLNLSFCILTANPALGRLQHILDTIYDAQGCGGRMENTRVSFFADLMAWAYGSGAQQFSGWLAWLRTIKVSQCKTRYKASGITEEGNDQWSNDSTLIWTLRHYGFSRVARKAGGSNALFRKLQVQVTQSCKIASR